MRVIKSLSVLSTLKSSSVATGAVGDGIRAEESGSAGLVVCLEVKRAKSSETRLLIS